MTRYHGRWWSSTESNIIKVSLLKSVGVDILEIQLETCIFTWLEFWKHYIAVGMVFRKPGGHVRKTYVFIEGCKYMYDNSC